MGPSTPLDILAESASPDGGWGYHPNQPSHPEPTCLALLALAAGPEQYAAVIDCGRAALGQHLRPDGSCRLAGARPEAVWPTALALFTRAVLGQPADELRPAAKFLLARRGQVIAADPEVADMIDIDFQLVGWPWATGNFSWVEPTAWAMLALTKVGRGGEPAVDEGRRMLLDRAFDEGGINYGNRRILGRMTEPIPGPTALMLLALQGHDHPRIGAALEYLGRALANSTDLEHLGYAVLACDVHRERPAAAQIGAMLTERVRETLRDHEQLFGSLPSPARLALAALALGTPARNPFRLDRPLPAHANGDGAATVPAEERAGFLARLQSRFRSFFIEGLGRMRPTPANSAVHITKADDYGGDLLGVLRRQFESFRASVPLAGKRVVLKPNLVEYHRDKVINTDPRFVSAVIELCRAEGAAEIVVAEGPGHWRNVEFLLHASGLGEVLKRHGVPFVDINHDQPVKTLNLGRLTGLEYLYLSKTITAADVLISLPKLKTHHWAGATLSLKNLFGTLPGICYGWPKNELHWRGIPNSIIDIALTTINPPLNFLAIVDGIVGMEGDGPLNGTAKHLGALVMGVDPVAVDATCCRLMGLNPKRVPYLMLGALKRLGTMEETAIPQLGEPIAALAQTFELPPRIEKQLLKVPA